jgi:hypothetical protein
MDIIIKMFTLFISLLIISNICNFLLYIKYNMEHNTKAVFIDTLVPWNIMTICIIFWICYYPENTGEKLSWLLSFIK